MPLEDERKNTEREQEVERLKFFSLLADQATDSTITTNLNYEITYANKAFEHLYGYSRDELLGRAPDILNAEPDSGEIQADIHRAVSAGKTWQGELLNRKKDGSTFPCEMSIFPLLDEKGNIFAYAGNHRDITERKRAEEPCFRQLHQARAGWYRAGRG